MFTTYILKSLIKEYYYVGYSENVQKRLIEHNAKLNKSTKPYAPFKLVHSEEFGTRSEAFEREQQIKRYNHGEAFKKLLV